MRLVVSLIRLFNYGENSNRYGTKTAFQARWKEGWAGCKRKYPAPALVDFEHNLFDHNAALRIAECGRLLIAAGRALLGSEQEI